jgi:hypothetical protein
MEPVKLKVNTTFGEELDPSKYTENRKAWLEL